MGCFNVTGYVPCYKSGGRDLLHDLSYHLSRLIVSNDLLCLLLLYDKLRNITATVVLVYLIRLPFSLCTFDMVLRYLLALIFNVPVNYSVISERSKCFGQGHYVQPTSCCIWLLFVLLLLFNLYLSHLMEKTTMWFPNRSDTNRPVQLQKQARSQKFWS